MRALLVIDMQVGCFTETPPAWDENGVVQRINALATATRDGGRVVFIQHTGAEDGLPHGSAPWHLLPALAVRPGDHVMEKAAADAFLETPLDAWLREQGVTELLITGYATEYCVDTTVRAAASRGYDVWVAADAHTTRDRAPFRAVDIREHHNFVWSDLILPRGRKIRVLETGGLLHPVVAGGRGV